MITEACHAQVQMSVCTDLLILLARLFGVTWFRAYNVGQGLLAATPSMIKSVITRLAAFGDMMLLPFEFCFLAARNKLGMPRNQQALGKYVAVQMLLIRC